MGGESHGEAGNSAETENSSPTEAGALPAETAGSSDGPSAESSISAALPLGDGVPEVQAGVGSGSVFQRPRELSEYLEWARKVLRIDLTESATELLYNSGVGIVQDTLENTPFFQGLVTGLSETMAEYKAQHGELLFMTEKLEIKLSRKPFDSVLDKTFRLNVVWNKNFPQSPNGGWVTPENWFSRIDDLIRTSIVCRFLDGPSRVCEFISAHATQHALGAQTKSRGLDEGYYAHHVYVRFPVDVLARGRDGAPTVSRQNGRVEFQVTTQLQDVLKNMTHRYYLADRSKIEKSDWKWDFQSNRFRARFLSHSLHLLEALIVDVRNNKT